MYPKDAFLNVGYNFAKLVSSFFLRNDMAKWLHYADTSASVIPVALMGLYKVLPPFLLLTHSLSSNLRCRSQRWKRW